MVAPDDGAKKMKSSQTDEGATLAARSCCYRQRSKSDVMLQFSGTSVYSVGVNITRVATPCGVCPVFVGSRVSDFGVWLNRLTGDIEAVVPSA